MFSVVFGAEALSPASAGLGGGPDVAGKESCHLQIAVT